MLTLDCFVGGLARDCADALQCSLRSLDSLIRCFQRADVVTVTNDSVDGTGEVLARWAGDAPSRTVLRPEGIAASVVGRTDRLAILRNFYLLEMRSRIKAGRRFDLMIVFDFDGVNRRIDLGDAVSDAVRTAPSGWGALFANQPQAYYDVWALRHPRWCPDDCWERVRRSKRFVPWPLRRRAQTAAIARFVGKRQVKICPNELPIEVNSAFGGLGVYKVPALDNAWYSGRDSVGREVCEHVAFNLCVRRGGAKLYVMPGLLNDAPLEHLLPGAGIEAQRPWE